MRAMMATKPRKAWRNRSGSVTVLPNHYSYPASIEEIQSEVRRAAEEYQRLRVAGSGSALTPLCWTDENLMSLERFHGIESMDLGTRRLWVRAGTRLGWLARALADRGLALDNWRGSAKQTLGGALTTGAHSGGAGLQCLSAQVTALRIVEADGSVTTLTPDSRDHFDAARVALGALGVITHAELQCVTAFRLHAHAKSESLDRTLANLERYNCDHRVFSFRWQPYSGSAQLQFLDSTELRAPEPHPLEAARDLAVTSARDWLLAQAARRLPGAAERASQMLSSRPPPLEAITDPHLPAVPASAVPRQLIEYVLPRAKLAEALGQMERVIRALRFPALLPVEVRFAAADGLWLSPCHQRDSAIVTVSTALQAPSADYFAAMTEIFDRHDGRPNWAAQHGKTAAELAPLYPRFADFQALRAKVDPHNMFLNPHLAALFGVETL